MAVFDVMNPPSVPDSDLESDVSLEKNITLGDLSVQPIAPGDWVDVMEGQAPPDPIWGMSYQVMSVYRSEGPPVVQNVTVMFYNAGETNYYIDGLDPVWMTGNYRKVPKVA